MKFKILIPFQRRENLDDILKNLSRENVEVILLTEEDIVLPETNFINCKVQVVQFKKEELKNYQCYNKINQYLDKFEIDSEAYYAFLADDDLYEKDFFKKIKEFNPRFDIFIVSLLRGQHKKLHDCTTLIASRSQMYVGGISGQQMFFKGSILKGDNGLRFPEDFVGDGLLAEQIREREIDFITRACVLFNALEPGRWDKERLEEYL